MRRVAFFLPVLLAFAPCGCPDGYGQCCGAACGQPAAFFAPPPRVHTWVKTEGVEEYGLFQDGWQIGSVRLSDGQYFSRLAPGQWTGPTACPVTVPAWLMAKVHAGRGGCGCTSQECDCDEDDCPCKAGHPPCSDQCRCVVARDKKAAARPACGCCRGCKCTRLGCRCRPNDKCCAACDCIRPEAKTEAGSIRNYGIVIDKVGRGGERYELGGRPVSRDAAISAVVGPQIPDDRAKPSLTFVGGTDAERKAALDAASQSPLADACLVQAYKADNPLMTHAGFVADGRPTTYLQRPDGFVLGRASDAAAATLAAVRKRMPNYQPEKDVDPTANKDGLLDVLLKKLGLPGSTSAWCCVAAGAFVLLLRKKENRS